MLRFDYGNEFKNTNGIKEYLRSKGVSLGRTLQLNVPKPGVRSIDSRITNGHELYNYGGYIQEAMNYIANEFDAKMVDFIYAYSENANNFPVFIGREIGSIIPDMIGQKFYHAHLDGFAIFKQSNGVEKYEFLVEIESRSTFDVNFYLLGAV